MIFFIVVLRAVAACLITNAHYTGIYPTDYLANGGLLGDGLFFIVSGYCLCNVKGTFGRWYLKRISRVYPPVVIMTMIYMLLGFYSLEDNSFIYWYLYPTYYHFIASIIILYIPFFFIMKNAKLKSHIGMIMVIIAVAWMFVYFVFYDKTYYHIDNVREPMIRFLFMECMLLGAWFRINDDKFRNIFRKRYLGLTFVFALMYVVCKVAFSKINQIVCWQLFNQIVIFVLLFFVFAVFSAWDKKLERMPQWAKSVISYISKITLEIYVVQYVLIDVIRPLEHFPMNWIVLTTSIIIAASLLHFFCEMCNRIFAKLCLLRRE